MAIFINDKGLLTFRQGLEPDAQAISAELLSGYYNLITKPPNKFLRWMRGSGSPSLVFKEFGFQDSGRLALQGEVFGHQKQKNGDSVRTSPVKTITFENGITAEFISVRLMKDPEKNIREMEVAPRSKADQVFIIDHKDRRFRILRPDDDPTEQHCLYPATFYLATTEQQKHELRLFGKQDKNDDNRHWNLKIEKIRVDGVDWTPVLDARKTSLFEPAEHVVFARVVNTKTKPDPAKAGNNGHQKARGKNAHPSP